MNLTAEEAQTHLQQVINEWWAARAQPLLGSQLKARILERIPEFDEQALGYRNFAAFVRDTDGVAIKFREQTDFIVSPKEHAAVLEETIEQRLHVRPDFWYAFVSFAVPNQKRAYDKNNDEIVKGAADAIPVGAVEIIPIPAEEQLAWRRRFIESLGDESPLATCVPELDAEKGFRAFADALQSRPELRRRWNTIWVNHVADYIKTWATRNDIPESAWLTTTAPVSPAKVDIRKRIYALFDSIPVDYLLDLKLPVRWFVEPPSPDSDQSDH